MLGDQPHQHLYYTLCGGAFARLSSNYAFSTLTHMCQWRSRAALQQGPWQTTPRRSLTRQSCTQTCSGLGHSGPPQARATRRYSSFGSLGGGCCCWSDRSLARPHWVQCPGWSRTLALPPSTAHSSAHSQQ